MDNFALEALVREITPFLLQQRIQKIKRLGDTGFALGFRSKTTNEFLMISLERSCPTLFLDHKVAPSHREASDWLLTLRKHLIGGKILDVRKEFSDRRVIIEVEKHLHSDSPEKSFLVLNLIPTRTNAFLLDNNQQALVSFHPVSNRLRQGVEIPHSQNLWAIDRISEEDFRRWVLSARTVGGRFRGHPGAVPSTEEDKGIESTASSPQIEPQPPVTLPGMSRYFVQEILCDATSEPEFLWQRFQSLLKRVGHGPYSPQIYFLKDRSQNGSEHPLRGSSFSVRRQLFLSPFPLECLSDYEHSQLLSLNAAAAEIYRLTASDALLAAAQRAEISEVDVRLEKKRRLLKNLKEDLRRNAGAEIYKKYADLLYAHQDKSPPGKNRARLVDLFDPSQREIEVELDPRLSWIQNAVRYSLLSRKAKRSIPLIASRIEKTEREITILSEKRQSLVAAIAIEEPEQAGGTPHSGYTISVESSRSDSAGPAPRQGENGQRQTPRDSLVRKSAKSFVSSDGLTILVGKSSKDNDVLTLKIAQGDDFWFHVADYGGSHVVLQNPQKLALPPHKSLLEAAGLAAYFSQARNASKVEVHYTQKKFVSKPKGSKPGLVRLKTYKSVSVKPARF